MFVDEHQRERYETLPQAIAAAHTRAWENYTAKRDSVAQEPDWLNADHPEHRGRRKAEIARLFSTPGPWRNAQPIRTHS